MCVANNQTESFSTGLVTGMSESMAGTENDGPASGNCATSKLAVSKTSHETEGMRVENFRPKLSTVPEDAEAVQRGGMLMISEYSAMKVNIERCG